MDDLHMRQDSSHENGFDYAQSGESAIHYS